MSAEKAHHFTFRWLKFLCRVPGVSSLLHWLFSFEHHKLEREVIGIKFKNPVGLAAGFDKDAKMIREFGQFGFGAIEIGTLTPKGQPGNPKPRLFRLTSDQGLINRMGFNNGGVEEAIGRLKRSKSVVVIGGNIGKNKVTPNENAEEDYQICLEKLYPYVDYFVVNVSSPNTPNLRELQDKEPLKKLLVGLRKSMDAKERPKPILLKIAPDLTLEQLDDIVEIVKEANIEGIIATNTTISRDNLRTSTEKIEEIGAGGLSGLPVKARSTQVIKYLRDNLGANFAIIGVGGIFTGEDALEKLNAGADLVQVYTGFIYEGPAMIKKINKYLAKNL